MDGPLKRFKRIIGRALSIIIARTRKDEFQVKQLYRRIGKHLKLITVILFKDLPDSGDLTLSEKLSCQSIENRAIFHLGFIKPQRS